MKIKSVRMRQTLLILAAILPIQSAGAEDTKVGTARIVPAVNSVDNSVSFTLPPGKYTKVIIRHPKAVNTLPSRTPSSPIQNPVPYSATGYPFQYLQTQPYNLQPGYQSQQPVYVPVPIQRYDIFTGLPVRYAQTSPYGVGFDSERTRLYQHGVWQSGGGAIDTSAPDQTHGQGGHAGHANINKSSPYTSNIRGTSAPANSGHCSSRGLSGDYPAEEKHH